jgi:hypothetical protein
MHLTSRYSYHTLLFTVHCSPFTPHSPLPIPSRLTPHLPTSRQAPHVSKAPVSPSLTFPAPVQSENFYAPSPDPGFFD